MTTATSTRTTTTRRRPELPLFSLPAGRDIRVAGRSTSRCLERPAVPVFSDGR